MERYGDVREFFEAGDDSEKTQGEERRNHR
jgi:hypothetical protein